MIPEITTELNSDLVPTISNGSENIKSEIHMCKGFCIYTQTKFNKFQKYLIKKCFGFEVKDV